MAKLRPSLLHRKALSSSAWTPPDKAGRDSCNHRTRRDRQSALFQTDIADPQQVNQAIERALDAFGNVDILVNNAASFEPGQVIELTYEEWSRQIATNLTGPFLLTQAVLPLMRKARYGRIVNITSGLAWNGAGGYEPTAHPRQDWNH